MNVRPLVIAMILAGLVASVLLFARAVPSNVFDYDESDYMYAVSKGFHANYLDEPSIPMGTFIDAGLHGVRGQSGCASLSAFIRSADDINCYRHYHAPLSFYWIMASRLVTGDGEMALRWTQMACVMLTFATIYLGCLSAPVPQARLAAFAASTLYLLSLHAAHDRPVDRAAQPLRAPRDAHADGDRPVPHDEATGVLLRCRGLARPGLPHAGVRRGPRHGLGGLPRRLPRRCSPSGGHAATSC